MVDHWWQTETGWSIAANPMGVEPLPIKAGSPTVPMPGYDVRILHDDGPAASRRGGRDLHRAAVAAWDAADAVERRRPLQASYLSEHPGYYLTGDGGRFDEDGYLFVMGRIDDVINVAGHRLSTGSIEEVLATHPAVAECAVIGVPDQIKGQAPRGLVVLKAGAPDRRAGRGTGGAGARRDRRGGAFRLVDVVPGTAEDAVGQDSAQDTARYRGRPRRTGAVDHRGSVRAGCAEADPARRLSGG